MSDWLMLMVISKYAFIKERVLFMRNIRKKYLRIDRRGTGRSNDVVVDSARQSAFCLDSLKLLDHAVSASTNKQINKNPLNHLFNGYFILTKLLQNLFFKIANALSYILFVLYSTRF